MSVQAIDQAIRNSTKIPERNDDEVMKRVIKEKETFLHLFLKQLKHQDPLNPMKSDKISAQFASLAHTEQQNVTNQLMRELVNLQKMNSSNEVINYIGKNINYNSSYRDFNGEPISFKYDLQEEAENVKVTILDENNRIIFETRGPNIQGENEFMWDGKNNNKLFVPKGKYKIDIKAQDNHGNYIPANMVSIGTVIAVHNIHDNPKLELENGIIISESEVNSVFNKKQ